MSHIILLDNGIPPASPGSGEHVIYYKDDGKLYQKDALGEEKLVGDALPLIGGTLTGQLKYANAVSIASAATVDLTTAGSNLVYVTETAAISAWIMTDGQVLDVVFTGAGQLTHNATTNNLAGGANLVRAAGDRATLMRVGTTVYLRLDEAPTISSSNANGSWTKFADGTLICTHQFTATRTCATLSNGFYVDTSIAAWNFPASFFVPPTYDMYAAASGFIGFSSKNGASITNASCYIATGSPLTALTFTISCSAIGRWKA